jgi:hypothetical protein
MKRLLLLLLGSSLVVSLTGCHTLIQVKTLTGKPVNYCVGAGWSKYGFANSKAWLDAVRRAAGAKKLDNESLAPEHADSVRGKGAKQPAAAVSVDLRNYDPKCGVNLSQADGALTVRWPTPEGATVMTLNLSGDGALVRSIAVTSGDAEPTVVLRDADPVTVLTLAERDLKKRNGWTIFFDHVDRKPRESGALVLKLKGASARSAGRRCTIDLDGLAGMGFSGQLRFTIYAGLTCPQKRIQSLC